MKYFLVLVSICYAAACQLKPRPDKAAVEIVQRAIDSSEKHRRLPPNATLRKDTLYVTGDFNGDRRKDTAFSFMSDSVNTFYDKCYVRFTSGSLPGLKPMEWRCRLVNEGDLDYDGADELSAFSDVLQDCAVYQIAFTFKNGKWEVFTGPHMIGFSCAPMTDKDLQDRMVFENDTLSLLTEEGTIDHVRLYKRVLRTKEYYSAE